METRYYFIRWVWRNKAYRPPGEPEEKELRPSWCLSTKKRAEMRQAARGQVEAFESFVVSLTETESDVPDKGTVVIRELETENWGTSMLTLTLDKGLLFGGEDEEYRDQIALDIWHSAAGCHLG